MPLRSTNQEQGSHCSLFLGLNLRSGFETMQSVSDPAPWLHRSYRILRETQEAEAQFVVWTGSFCRRRCRHRFGL
ncbi:hypothetical protein I7I48_01741 [Histoplasma ohiense]|nr:hypothetical protein I7I48_01741 [Histoplasma ohiense (nom. inval.)]